MSERRTYTMTVHHDDGSTVTVPAAFLHFSGCPAPPDVPIGPGAPPPGTCICWDALHRMMLATNDDEVRFSQARPACSRCGERLMVALRPVQPGGPRRLCCPTCMSRQLEAGEREPDGRCE